MPIIHANPEERRHGGWLARAEGRVKTRGVPIGPRPASLQRILDGPESAPSSSCGGAEDATDVRREVGSGRRNDARDVIAVKQVLHEAGLYTMPCPAVPSPIFDSEMRVAIRTFQGRHGLKEDGVIRPGDLLHKRLLDAVQIARCQALTAQLPELLIRNSAAHRKIEEAQDHLKVVDAEIKRLANQLRKFRLGHWVQWLLEATAESRPHRACQNPADREDRKWDRSRRRAFPFAPDFSGLRVRFQSRRRGSSRAPLGGPDAGPAGGPVNGAGVASGSEERALNPARPNDQHHASFSRSCIFHAAVERGSHLGADQKSEIVG